MSRPAFPPPLQGGVRTHPPTADVPRTGAKPPASPGAVTRGAGSQGRLKGSDRLDRGARHLGWASPCSLRVPHGRTRSALRALRRVGILRAGGVPATGGSGLERHHGEATGRQAPFVTSGKARASAQRHCSLSKAIQRASLRQRGGTAALTRVDEPARWSSRPPPRRGARISAVPRDDGALRTPVRNSTMPEPHPTLPFALPPLEAMLLRPRAEALAALRRCGWRPWVTPDHLDAERQRILDVDLTRPDVAFGEGSLVEAAAHVETDGAGLVVLLELTATTPVPADHLAAVLLSEPGSPRVGGNLKARESGSGARRWAGRAPSATNPCGSGSVRSKPTGTGCGPW